MEIEVRDFAEEGGHGYETFNGLGLDFNDKRGKSRASGLFPLGWMT